MSRSVSIQSSSELPSRTVWLDRLVAQLIVQSTPQLLQQAPLDMRYCSCCGVGDTVGPNHRFRGPVPKPIYRRFQARAEQAPIPRLSLLTKQQRRLVKLQQAYGIANLYRGSKC